MIKCLHPIIMPGRRIFGCGHCMPCRVKKGQIWITRMLLEGKQHRETAFVGLSIEDKNLTANRSLVPRDFDLWMKRERIQLVRHNDQVRIRYYGIGEYGEQSERPHYHCVVFGAGCRFGHRVRTRDGGWECQCVFCTTTRNAWSKGHIQVGLFGTAAAKYVAKYIVKRLTGAKADEWLKGREPEFARVSRMPALGHGSLDEIAETFTRWERLARAGDPRFVDVPSTVQIGGRKRPIGTVLQRKLREAAGREPECPQAVIDAVNQSHKLLWAGADAICAGPGMAGLKNSIVKELFYLENKQAAQNMEARAGLTRSRRR